MNNKKSNIKKRNWAFIIYPTKAQLDNIGSTYDGSSGYGTLPDDWFDILQQTGLQCAISPLHDKDKLEDGSDKIKKPHYHIISCYSGPTSFNVVKGLCDSLNAPIPQALEQIRGYYRYLTHKDNPDKAQYSETEIKTINGFNISDYVELTRSEVNEVKRQIQKIIRNKDIIEYADLLDFLFDNDLLIEYDIASSNTLLFNTYISSRRHRGSQTSEPVVNAVDVDSETGEIIEHGEHSD